MDTKEDIPNLVVLFAIYYIPYYPAYKDTHLKGHLSFFRIQGHVLINGANFQKILSAGSFCDVIDPPK